MCLSSDEGAEEPASKARLMQLLDSVTDALVWSISKTGLSFQQCSTRLAHLLMLLSHIRHVSTSGIVDVFTWFVACTDTRLLELPAIMLSVSFRHSNKGMDHLHCMKMKKMVPLYDLLLEMLDAHIMHSSRLPHAGPGEPSAPKNRPRAQEPHGCVSQQ
ncbi:hypothetical protein P4O66_001053 [Electrophorus voltai]|uniref:NR LBD domain-containing protein n=1 Tax=Electrophorus voltai TaxID=2609070 RepID=A0AAD9DXZ8_9TELE|nr:hypothetical protein P4O66_001053 [Electrophorus voltai]